ncbi:MAG: hypothetical protein SNJ71_04400, partial [Bacteroidales bacterium]
MKTSLLFNIFLIKILLSTFLLVNYNSYSQQVFQWKNTVGGTNKEYPFRIVETYDKGYLIISTNYSSDGNVNDAKNNDGSGDIWVTKFDKDGKYLWGKSYGGTDYDYASDIQATPDSGFIFIGYTYSTDKDVTKKYSADYTDIWIVKADKKGQIEWEKTYGGLYDDYGRAIAVTPEGDYLVLATSYSKDGEIGFNHDKSLNTLDIWFAKLNKKGDIIWNKVLGGTKDDEARQLLITNKGEYLLACYTKSNDGDIASSFYADDVNDIWLILTDTAGKIIKQKTYGGFDNDIIQMITPTQDGGFVFVGYTFSDDGDVTKNHNLYSYTCDIWAVKIDVQGTIQWQKTIGGDDNDYGRTIHQTYNNKYVITAHSYSSNYDLKDNYGDADIWIIVLDEKGKIEWKQNYGGSLAERPQWSIYSPEKGLTITGFTSSNDIDFEDMNNGETDVFITNFNGTKTYEYYTLCEDKTINIRGTDYIGKGYVWDTLTNIYGADSIITSYIRLVPKINNYSHSLCVGDSVYLQGAWIKEAGYYTDSLKSVNGICDSIVITQVSLLETCTAPKTAWSKNYGGSKSEAAYSVCNAWDKGFILAGYTNSSDKDIKSRKPTTNNYYDAWICALDDVGNILWEKTYGGGNEDVINSIIPLPDSTYLACGYTYSKDKDIKTNKGNGDVWLLKIDKNGNVIFSLTYGGAENDYGNSMYNLPDGNIIVCGQTKSIDGDIKNRKQGINNWDFWIFQVNKNGVLQWQKTYGGSDSDVAYWIRPDNNRNYYVSGNSRSKDGDFSGTSYKYTDTWLMKLNENGDILWNKPYGGNQTDYNYAFEIDE